MHTESEIFHEKGYYNNYFSFTKGSVSFMDLKQSNVHFSDPLFHPSINPKMLYSFTHFEKIIRIQKHKKTKRGKRKKDKKEKRKKKSQFPIPFKQTDIPLSPFSPLVIAVYCFSSFSPFSFPSFLFSHLPLFPLSAKALIDI